jgi:P27 family predicted phage terminase small subunit
MDKPTHLSDDLADIWDELAPQVTANTPTSAMEAICRQMQLMRDCSRRIQSEGSVVMDAKGNATEHPAIKIERDAGKQLRDWLKQYRRRGVV